MTRARETADIIHKSLPSLEMTESDLLREGAPYPPEPPLRRWRPDYKVCDRTFSVQHANIACRTYNTSMTSDCPFVCKTHVL